MSANEIFIEAQKSCDNNEKMFVWLQKPNQTCANHK